MTRTNQRHGMMPDAHNGKATRMLPTKRSWCAKTCKQRHGMVHDAHNGKATRKVLKALEKM